MWKFYCSLIISLFFLSSCELWSGKLSNHAFESKTLGKSISLKDMEALIDQPGPIEVTTYVGAEWSAQQGGLLNLDHPDAVKAKLKNDMIPIQIFTHKIKHPDQGLYLIDTGLSQKFYDHPEKFDVGFLLKKIMYFDLIRVVDSTEKILAQDSPEKWKGVFMTHMHFDHVSGMNAIPNDIPIYAGPGETQFVRWTNYFTQGITDLILTGKGPIQELQFFPDDTLTFSGLIDVFSDHSFFAIHVPGHTPGSIAYLARTKSGPVLFVGDTCHTRWGWEHLVEPGDFTTDQSLNRKNLLALAGLAKRHPQMKIQLGHQH